MAGSNFPFCLEVKSMKSTYSGSPFVIVCVLGGLFVFLYGLVM